MSRPAASNDDSEGSGARRYPFGLSSRLALVLVLLIGIVGSGLASSVLEVASLPLLSDIVFVTGYGTMLFVVWYVWIRPIDFSDSAGQIDIWSDNDTEKDGSRDGTAATSDETEATEPLQESERAD